MTGKTNKFTCRRFLCIFFHIRQFSTQVSPVITATFCKLAIIICRTIFSTLADKKHIASSRMYSIRKFISIFDIIFLIQSTSMSENTILYRDIPRTFIARVCHPHSSYNIINIVTSLLIFIALIQLYIYKTYKIILISRYFYMKCYRKHIRFYDRYPLRVFRCINHLRVYFILIAYLKYKKHSISLITFQTCYNRFVCISRYSYHFTIFLCLSINNDGVRFSSISSFYSFIHIRLCPFRFQLKSH